MNNTVLLTAKGLGGFLTLNAMSRFFPESSFREIPPKWWQSNLRYQLRLQNLSSIEIEELRSQVELYRPLSTKISMEVF